MLNLPNISIVGLTGMSGAGKSTVCGVFAEYGYEIVDCDNICRKVAAAGSPFLNEISERLSPKLIKPDGSLDRELTARLIFGDNDKRTLYNKLIYPYVTYSIIDRIKCADSSVLLDAPTLFEARLEGICGSIVAVVADEGICLRRIMERDNITESAAAARLSAQHSADFFRANSDFCIENNGTAEQLFQAAKEITERLKEVR